MNISISLLLDINTSKYFENAREEIESKGFKLNLTMIASKDDIIASVSENNYDLIILQDSEECCYYKEYIDQALELKSNNIFVLLNCIEDDIIELLIRKKNNFQFSMKGDFRTLLYIIHMEMLKEVVEKKFKVAEKELQSEKEMLKKAKDLAVEANKLKGDFLANISHEIRTPLNGIKGMIDLILLSDLKKEDREYLNIAYNSTESLLNIIESILDFSKLEAGKVVLENIDFNFEELLEKTIKPYIIRANEKNLELKYEIKNKTPKYVNGDPNRLQQVLNNMLGNAVKFTKKGNIHLKVERIFDVRKENIVLIFTISDTGIGISNEESKYLFKEFSQVDSSISRKYGGTGLGLCISKSLVEAMGGNIWYDSIKDKGSNFYFSIEVEPVKTVENLAQDKSNKNIAKDELKILLVEDNEVNQIVTASIITKRGHKVVLANNGLEAINLIEKESYDLVLMDIQMPEMDGIMATKIIRDMEKKTKKHTPIILLTAHIMRADREKYLAIGVDDYLTKPLQIDEFYEKIEGYTKRED